MPHTMYPDEAASTRNRPQHLAGAPYPALLKLKNDSWLPSTACSTMIWPNGGGI